MHHVSVQQIMFEDYQFEGVAIGIQPILSLYARGQLSSICIIMAQTLPRSATTARIRSRSQQECSHATLQCNEKTINNQQLFAFVQLTTTKTTLTINNSNTINNNNNNNNNNNYLYLCSPALSLSLSLTSKISITKLECWLPGITIARKSVDISVKREYMVGQKIAQMHT